MKQIFKKVKFAYVLLLIVFALSALAFSVGTITNSDRAAEVYADGEHIHGDITFNAWTSTNSLPSSGSYYLTTDVSISGRVTVSGTLNLCLNGHGIRQTGNTNVFYITSGNKLNLYDCDETTEHKYTVASPAENGAGLATVNDNATGDYKTFVGGYITGGKGHIPSDYGMGGAIQLGFSSTYGGTFNMYGGTIIGNTINVSSTNAYGGGVYVKSGGVFNMYGGAITGNKAAAGGGVFVEGYNASVKSTFNMYGGTIDGNYVTGSQGGGVYVSANSDFLLNDGSISNNYVYGGAGGGVFYGGTTFTMNGGAINGNIAAKKSYSGGNGGGIYWQSRGEFTLNGGYIKDNTAESYAGIGVSAYLYSGYSELYFTMNGGVIEGNVAKQTVGGIYVSGSISGSSATTAIYFTINGGEIKNNSATYNYTCGTGLYVTGKVDFALNGGSITGNTAVGERGGVYVGSGVAMSLSGSPVISGNTDKNGDSNLYLYDGVIMTVTGKLGEDALIGIYKDKNGVFTSGLEGNGSIANFVADDGDMYFIRETDGEAEFVKKAVLTYHGNGYNSGAVPSQETYMPNSEVTVSGNTGELVKKGRIFDGWNTKADGSGETYRAGDTFEIAQDTTFYANWIHNDTHDDADFVKWTATDSLPDAPGDYYLTACVTITSTWNVPAGVTKICLNGFGIKLSGNGSVMSVGEGATLYIYDCYTSTNYYYTYPTNYYGLATNVGGTSWESGKTSFNGGYITGGNGTLDGNERKGGALYIANGGKAFIHGGKFIGNSANYGGVFFVRSGSSLTIADSAEILYNATVGNATWHSGGAVFIENDATVYMTGGKIYNNYACGNRGGGVQVEGGSFYLSGGSITGNRTNGGQGAGVCVWGGSMYVSGNPQVLNNRNTQNTSAQNNVYIHEMPARFYVVGELTGTDGNIGILLNDYSGSFTNTADEYKEYNRASAFSSDNTSYIIIQNDNGQLSFIDGNTVALVKNGDVKSYYTDFSAALNAWTDGGTLTLLKDVSISSTIAFENCIKTLDLNGYGIKKTGTGRVFNVGNGATLNLYDSNPTTVHRYSVSNPAANGAGVATVNDSLTSNYQTFTGGYITGGYLGGGYQYGAGINLEGNGATLNMYGGTIIGNQLTAGSTGGGGVCLQDWDKSGGFYMYGGSIIGNTSNYGGGVYVRCGTMELIDGNISKNVAKDNIGGGILVFGENFLIVKGGSISNNLAVHGGAIEASGGGSVTISGGNFTNNIATGKGGALTNQRTDGNTSPAYFNISGAPVFSDNKAGGLASDIYLCNTAVLNLTAVMTNTTKIGISKASNTGVFTSGWNDYMEDADPFDYFTSDNGSYEIRLSDDEAYVGVHVHAWTFAVNGNVITATCAGIEKGTCPLTAQTLTLNAAGKPYDGQSVTATVVKSAGWMTENDLPAVADIVYSGNTNAGTYTASITVAEKTATVEFTITPIDVTITITGHNDTVDYDRNEHTVSGYDVVFGSDLYTSEDFTFSGTDTVALTNVGTQYMGLAASQFENTNDNFNTVTFNVTDGYITVEPIDVTITITGHNDTVDYDRKEHTVSGYDVEFSTDVYIAEDYIFSGTDTVTLTNVGTVYMGLSEEYFENINTNFATVTFEITDGYITVEPIDVTVTITGHNDTVDYDRNEHTVSGYDVEFSTDVYIAEDYIFSGTDTVTLTNVGTVYMELSEEQFENINTNFATVTFEITDGYITVEPIDVTVTITGHNDTVDYDGMWHSVSGYDAVPGNDLYDVLNDFTFSGEASVRQANAGTSYMGLSEEQFENINTNFATVTFEITDGYITVEPIDVTITITGHSDTVDYDGTAHRVVGYEASSDNGLYNVNKDIVLSGIASAIQTEVGTGYMGLDASRFTNRNDNFATVTFEITDGYITIEPIDATVIVVPYAQELVYDGTEQQLIVAGEADGGTLYYALSLDDAVAPADNNYGTAIPSAKEVGKYYVWYKVIGDKNHNDLLPVCVKAVVAEEEWPSLYGVVYNNDGTPSVGAVVTLISGNQTIDHVTTDADGNYRFSVLAGVYNIVAEYEDITETVFVTVFEETELDIVMPDGKTESILNVNTEGGEELGVAVGGLNGEAQAVRKENPSADNVAVIMTVEKTTEDGAVNADPIVKSAEDKTLSFFEIKVEKTVDSVTTAMDETDNVMEIAIPYEKTGKRGITVYSYHDSKVRTFVESDSKADGTFRVDKANKIIYVYANKFSTYAIGYTPYYRVQTSLSLGSYTGKASVTLQNNADAKIKFTLNDTDVNKLVFPDVPKGQYTMTVTWGEGNTNTLKMALTVGPKVVLLPITEQETQNEETDAQIFAATDTADEAEIISENGNAETGVVAGIGYEAVVFGQIQEIATAQKINREIVMIPRRRD